MPSRLEVKQLVEVGLSEALRPIVWLTKLGLVTLVLAALALRIVGVIWVNRRTTSEVRATVQSLLAQAEYAGEIVLGLSLGALAQLVGLPFAFLGASALLALAAGLVVRSPVGSRSRSIHE